MNREDMTQFCVRAAQWFLCASFFSPLVLVSGFFFPYIVPKTIFFQLAVECALFFYVLLWVLDKRYAPKFDMLTKAVLVFFSVWALAGICGANPMRSFFGTYERMLSVVNMAHFIALYIIARAVFARPRDWLFAFRAFIGVSVLVSAYGVGQKLGLPWLYHTGIDRIDSTVGNAAFLAAYLMFAVFFALVLLVRDEHRSWHGWYAASIALNGAIIYLTGTRGAALGIVIGILFLGVAYAFRPARSSSEAGRVDVWWWGAALTLMVIALLVLETHNGGIGASLKRFTSVSLADTTVQTRILSYSTSWKGFLARSLLGWGPENYNLAFDKFYNPKLYPTENWFDHAHNIVFDMLTEAGAAGFLTYFFLVGYLALLILKRSRSAQNHYWPRMILFALLVSYMVQNLFVFDSLVTYLPFFLLCAYIGSGFLLGAKEAPKAHQEKILHTPVPNIGIWLLIVFLAGAYWMNVRPALASYWAARALSVGAGGDVLSSRDDFKIALSFSNFGKDEIRGKLADFASSVLDGTTDENAKKEISAYTIDEMQKSLKESPLDFRNYIYLSTYLSGNYDTLSSYGIPALDIADKTLAKAQPLGPDKPALYVEWGKVKFIKKDYIGAAQMFARTLELSPTITDVQFKLAMSYHRAGRDDEAFRIYNQIAEKGVALSADDYAYLAIGFWDSGDMAKAVAAAQKAAELDPSLKDQSDRFIRDILSGAHAK